MGNAFVDYLNYMNNAGSDTAGALAEYQATDPFYEKIRIDRKLGTDIAEAIRQNQHQAYILTGHAGDGKTSILLQVLRDLQLLPNGEPLKETDSFTEQNKSLYYVKDMSEIPEKIQVSLLKKALDAPENGQSSILVSNTGPLLNCFAELYANEKGCTASTMAEEDRISVQSILLSQLDENVDKPISIGSYSFKLINIARIDNVPFVKKILCKILNDELWQPCKTCSKAGVCPIYNNICQIRQANGRVEDFIESFYRFLYENDKRLTIRQILSHISFAITGNLTCDINFAQYKQPLFDFNIANLFFGYNGYEKCEKAQQIKGISMLQKQRLDEIALNADYNLFVNEDISGFSQTHQEIMRKEMKKNDMLYFSVTEDNISTRASRHITQYRKAVRRFYLLFSCCENEKEESTLLDQLYGATFSAYTKLTNSPVQGKRAFNAIQNLVFSALYMQNTGCLPLGNAVLPLTLRRQDDVFQNVMLVMGTVKKDDLEIKQQKPNNSFGESSNKQQLIMLIRNNQTEFILTLPLLTYFADIVDGKIISNCNPALTHGAMKLNTLLAEEFSYSKAEEIHVLVNTTQSQQRFKITLDTGYIDMEGEN
jgi:hypothetical protein